jgi:hypothetical protein
MTLAGLWIASGLCHRASSLDSSCPIPVAATVSVGSTPPAWATAPEVVVSTFSRG